MITVCFTDPTLTKFVYACGDLALSRIRPWVNRYLRESRRSLDLMKFANDMAKEFDATLTKGEVRHSTILVVVSDFMVEVRKGNDVSRHKVGPADRHVNQMPKDTRYKPLPT